MATNRRNNTVLTIRKADPKRIAEAVSLLASKEVLVGIPESETDRPSDPDGKQPPTNAMIGYVMEHGMPELNIPARPHLQPGIRSVVDVIGERFKSAAVTTITKPNGLSLDQKLNAIGLIAQSGVRNYIDAGVGPPLSERTLRDRASRGRKGALQELENRSKGEDPSLELAKPLVDTGEYRKSITYVVRDRRARKE